VKATRRVRLLPEVQELYVFPHMGDGGLALGAAVAASAVEGTPACLDLERLDWGPGYDDRALADALGKHGFADSARPEPDLPLRVAQLLEEGRVVMWFQGRMEYGPRALGHRSVLARPDRPALRDRLNLVLKRRVWYQPFCPSMLESEGRRLLTDWSGTRNRAMTVAHEVKAEWRELLGGVISVDGTCRPQFVPDEAAGPFAAVLREGRRRWGAGAVLNTSFNIHGEPLVCTPAEALDVFARSGADALALGPFLVHRAALETVTAAGAGPA
jgi:carbamoyltransferase